MRYLCNLGNFFNLWFNYLTACLRVSASQTHLRRSLWACSPLWWSLVQTPPSTKPWLSLKSVLTSLLQWGTLFDKTLKISSSFWLLRVELYKSVIAAGLTAALDKRLSPSVFRAWQRTTLRLSNTSLLRPSMTSLRECWLGFYCFNAVRCLMKSSFSSVQMSGLTVRIWIDDQFRWKHLLNEWMNVNELFQNWFWRGADWSSAA